MKKILVTGACGFIGSHLTEMLLNLGYNVKALVFYNSFNSFGWLENMAGAKNLEIVTGDVRDGSFCRSITKDIDTIYHLAALIAIPYSYVAPENYVDTNVKGTLNILQAALENGKRRVIHISTSEVYGTALYVPIDEKHPRQPQSPYSASKIAADALALSYFSSFGLPVTVARPFNTFGPRQSARAVIPSIISQIASGVKKIKVGDTTPTRDFNYVEDTCRGLVSLGSSDKVLGEEVNIGSGSEISIGETFSIIRSIMKADCEIQIEKDRMRPISSEVYRLCCDNSKIKSLAGHTAQNTFEKGLEKTITWFTANNNLTKYKPGLNNL